MKRDPSARLDDLQARADDGRRIGILIADPAVKAWLTKLEFDMTEALLSVPNHEVERLRSAAIGVRVCRSFRQFLEASVAGGARAEDAYRKLTETTNG